MGCQKTRPPVHPQLSFVQAAESRQKEAERLICHGHRQGLPRLDSEVDVSAIQLVGHQMSREEIGDLYHQVYVLKRLPGPPPLGPKQAEEVMNDILSSLKDCLRQRRREQLGGSGEPEPTSTCPSCHGGRASQRERWDTSGEQELAKAREAHQQALVATAILEQWIERLSQSTTRVGLDVCHCSQSQDWLRRKS